MSTGILGRGASLTLAGTAVGSINNISGPDISRGSIDITTMDSSSNVAEFIPGIIDNGEVTIDLQYDGTTNAKLLKDYVTATAASIVVTIPDGGTLTTTSTYTGTGFLTKLGHAIPFDGKVTQSATFKLTGALTLA